MRYSRNTVIIIAGIILLSGCVKDTIYNTDHPDQALVTILTDWSDRGTDVTRPDTYNITANGVSENTSAERHTLRTLLDPANYTFILYNVPEDITVSDGTADVNIVAAPDGISGTFVNPHPGWLFTGTSSDTLEKDTEPTVAVSMHQQVRQLTLIIEPDGGAAGDITGMDIVMSGVAGMWNIVTDFPSGEAVNVTPLFAKQADGNWSATLRLIGVTGAEQKLAGTLTVAHVSAPVTLDSDLTNAMASFNTGKMTPLTLRSGIAVEPDPAVEAGFSATISNWTIVSGSGTAD